MYVLANTRDIPFILVVIVCAKKILGRNESNQLPVIWWLLIIRLGKFYTRMLVGNTPLSRGRFQIRSPQLPNGGFNSGN